MPRSLLRSLPLLLAPVAAAGDLVVEPIGSFPPAVTHRINDAGQVSGDFQFESVTRAMRYDPGVGRVPLAVPAGTTQSIGIGINAAGAVAGRISHPTLGTVAAIWSPRNEISLLPNPDGNFSYSTAVAIGDTGTVAGFATLAIVGPDPQQAWRWHPRTGYQLLPGLGGVASICRDMNAEGWIVGHSQLASGAYRAVVWNPQGEIVDLGPLPGASQTFGLSINDAGMVVGTTTANTNAILHRPGLGWQVLPDFGFKAVAYDINAAGWILGWADRAPFETVPVVWDPEGTMHDLSALVDPNRFFFPGDFSVPIAISDLNVVVVRGMDFTLGGDPRVLLFQVSRPSPCPADLDGSGSVDAADLAALLAAWGGSGPADLDGDGIVTASDLAILLGAWGPC
jgi:probable HAF family extracellular repeat protein